VTSKILSSFIVTTLALPILLFSSQVSAEEAPSRIVVESFSSLNEQQFKKRWKNYNFSLFGARTDYQLVSQQGQQVLRATSNGAASGLIRKLSVNLEEYPVLNWHWQTISLPKNGDDHSKTGDDHSLRLYVIFDSPETNLLSWIKNSAGLVETHALNYVWANQATINTQLANPYTDRSMMIAASSGEAQLGQWQTISRNIAADYQRAFGHKPPPVTAIAIMTDSDNTNSKLTSFYGDIYFSQLQATKQLPLAQAANNLVPCLY